MKRYFVGCLLAGLLSLALQGQVGEMPEILKNFGLNPALLKIYPAADFERYPAALQQLSAPLWMTKLIFYTDSSTLNSYRTIDYPGTGRINGSLKSSEAYSWVVPSVKGFFPLGKQMVLGAAGNFSWNSLSVHDVYDDYNADPEDYSEEGLDYTLAGGGELFFAHRFDRLCLGYDVAFNYQYDPCLGKWRTAPGENDGNPFLVELLDDATDQQLIPEVTLSCLLDLPALQVYLGVTGYYYHWVYEYSTLVDMNQDGYDDALATWEEVMHTGEPWGAALGGPNPEYTQLNCYTDGGSGLSAGLTFPVSPRFTLIASGYCTLFGSNQWFMYERYTENDLSQLDVTARYLNLDFYAGCRWQFSPQWELRCGAGAEYYSRNQVDNSLDLNGASVFAAENPGHYVEVDWPGEPDNGTVAGSVSPWFDTCREDKLAARGLLSLEWQPASNVILFNRLTASFNRTSLSCNVFNTADNSVWGEQVQSLGGSLDLSALTGAGVYLTEKLFLGLTSQSSWLDWSTENDFLPETGGVLSSGGTGIYSNQESSGHLSAEVNLFAIISY